MLCFHSAVLTGLETIFSFIADVHLVVKLKEGVVTKLMAPKTFWLIQSTPKVVILKRSQCSSN